LAVDTFLALVVYAFVTSITPGPNNLMLLASGVNFGFRRTIPHMLGISVGFASLLAGVGLGLGALLTALPGLHFALKLAGGAYLLWLAWKIAMARQLSAGKSSEHPLTLMQAAAFQWVNIKAWVMAVTAMAVYADAARPFLSSAIIVAAFTAVNLPSVSIWALFGQGLRGFLADPVRLKWFNLVMGAALAATLVPMLR